MTYLPIKRVIQAQVAMSASYFGPKWTIPKGQNDMFDLIVSELQLSEFFPQLACVENSRLMIEIVYK